MRQAAFVLAWWFIAHTHYGGFQVQGPFASADQCKEYQRWMVGLVGEAGPRSFVIDTRSVGVSPCWSDGR